MNLLIDTDVLIDVALDRQPFSEKAVRLLEMLETGTAHQGFVAWHSLANFYYLVSANKDRHLAHDFICELLVFIQVAPTGTQQARDALSLGLSDFEDALQVVAATACQARYIVTRNIRHYRKSPIPAVTPGRLLLEIDKS